MWRDAGELTGMTWRTSSPSSSWVPSTPWPDRRWLWPAFTSWSSSWDGWCTPLPTCSPCERQPALWPTLWRRYLVSPWLCRFWWQSQRTPKYPKSRDWRRVFLWERCQAKLEEAPSEGEHKKKTTHREHKRQECQWQCNMSCVISAHRSWVVWDFVSILFYLDR